MKTEIKCPLCGDVMVRPKLSPGCLTHQYQTRCPFVWNDLTEEQMEVLRAAALGRAVRSMTAWMFLYQNSIGWFCGTEMSHGTREYGERHDTPEAALKAAGLMEGEEK